MAKVYDRVQETTLTVGIGPLDLAGPVVGYRSFAAAVPNNDEVYYVITFGDQWELGRGTYDATLNTLSRDYISASTNGGMRVPFPAGVKYVFISTTAAAFMDMQTTAQAATDAANAAVTASNNAVTDLQDSINEAVNTAQTANAAVANLQNSVSQALTTAQNAILEITDDVTSNDVMYPLFNTTATGTVEGVCTSSSKLTYNPGTGVLTATQLNTSSDRRLKQDIEQIDQADALNIVEQLSGVQFSYVDGGESAGVIAQDLQEVLPHVVQDRGDGYLTVNYNALIPYLIEAVKQLSAEVKQLKAGRTRKG